MKAVLMAGGSGTRLRPLTCDLPKPMVPILNKPIIGHIISLLKKHNFTDIIVTLYYLPQIIQDYLKDGSDFDVNINYSLEEHIPLGTAGSVKNIQKYLDDTFIVISGDSLTDFDLVKAVEFHKERNSIATIVLTRVPNPLEYGVVITDDRGRIVRFLEKPTSSEVFSDTVNTGIYILDPIVLEFLPPNEEKDFSKDLFPLLLKQNAKLYGYISEGYWCDIGNLETYRKAHYDILNKKVNLEIDYYKEEYEGIWIGEGSVIEQSVVMEAPLVIGNNCYIGHGCRLTKETVVGDNVVISEKSSLKKPIIWSGTYIDHSVSLRGCTLANNITIRKESEILEGAVIGADCSIGEKVIIKPDVRIWPKKNIEPNSMVTDSIIWGTGAPTSLFDELGVSGAINIDITPEFAVKIGAAYGASIGMGKSISASRDQTAAARLFSRAFMSGCLSVGVDIQNLEDTAIPIVRHNIPSLGVAGGVHIRMNPDKDEQINIEFLDTSGLNIAPSMEKKIESTFYKEDFRRALIKELGSISYPARIREQYQESFLNKFNEYKDLKPLKIVVDYAFLISKVLLPTLLGKLGMKPIVLNAHISEYSDVDKNALLNQLPEIVLALKADFGVQLDSDGERFVLVDNKGRIVRDNKLLLLMLRLILEENRGKSVAVPVMAPSKCEYIVEKYNGTTIRTKASSRSLMEAAKKTDVILAGYGGKFIWPKFHPGFDSMFSVATIACLIASKGIKISEIVDDLPEIYMEHEQLPCQTSQKGMIMRVLLEKYQNENIDMTDGIKIFTKDGWILILPDAVRPIIHLYADSDSKENTINIIREYKLIVNKILNDTNR